MKLDLVIRLREARRLAGLTQKDAAKKAGVGEKTLSSFETGVRISALKVEQLRKLLVVYNLTEEQFYGDAFADKLLEQQVTADTPGVGRLVAEISSLDDERRERLIRSFLDMASLARQSQQRGRRIV